MADRSLPKGSRLAAGRERAITLYKSHRLRKTLLILLGLVVLFALLGFFAAPSIIKGQIESRASTALQRPVTLGAVHLNPFTLRLELDQLHIGERDGKTPFVDVDKIIVNASWASLFRRAPILDELSLKHPQVHLVRTADQKYNFYDLVQQFVMRPAAPDEPPARFALSNISIHDGDIQFHDAVHDVDHRVDQLELGIPFIANLPSATDIFVQPLLAMRVDGSPMRIESKAKPFAAVRDSATRFTFDKLDLPKYLTYAPFALPITVKRGLLSGDLELHFVMISPVPQMQLTGTLAMDDFVVAAGKDTPLLELGHGTIGLTQVEPLVSRHHFGTIDLRNATLHYTRMAGGHSNLDALTGGSAPARPGQTPTQVHIDTVTLQGSRLDYADLSGKAPARLSLDNIHGSLRGLSTVAGPAGSIDLTAGMAGGSIAANGKLDLAHSRYTGKVGLKNVALAPLIPLAPPMLNADIPSGTIDADGQMQATWSPTLNVHLEPAQASLNDFALAPHGGKTTPVAWKTMKADIASYDMAGSEAHLNSLTFSGLQLDVKRLRNGRIDLTGVMVPPVKGAPATPAFRWSVAHMGLDDGAVTFRDESVEGRPALVKLGAKTFAIDNLSDDMHKPLKLDLNGTLGKGGAFAVNGTVRPQPLDANLQVKASRLDLAPLVPLITVPLNVHIVSAQLALNGRMRYSDRGSQPARIDYRGQATLARVRVQDKVSGDDFLHWNALSASGTDLRMGEGATRVTVAGLALDDFYARMIVNANGRINLQDVVANQAEAPVSVTRAQDGTAPKPAEPAPATSTAAAVAPVDTGPKPEVQIGQITLTRGQLNYTDNFIKPNYTANITQLTGKVGAFGTAAGGPPAELTVQGQLDDNAPVNIDGTMNPLAPVAFLDVKAKADGVELTHLSPYSGKYAGYPITKGRLTVDVHYLLDQGKLTADNHIFIDQLTFGDRIEGPGVSHLPVKLAVALLKNSQGQIDVHVPVSGSLDDPKFSMAGLIWRAIGNLIMRAVTSPFRLLASAGGSNKDLGYVAFAPGSAALDTEAQSRLADIVKVLNDKTSLNLDVTGRMDPSKDETGLRQVMVQDLVVKEKMDDQGDEAGVDPATVKVDPAEYDKYLEKAYKHTKFPKPRNFVGLAKSQPPDEMKKLLEANMPVDQDALRHLAERRASAVRQWLHGKIDDNRIFVLAPKLDAKGIDDDGKTTRVDFGLH